MTLLITGSAAAIGRHFVLFDRGFVGCRNITGSVILAPSPFCWI